MKICVVGCERSGTTAIASLLGKASGLSLLNDPPESWQTYRDVYQRRSGIPWRLWFKLQVYDIVKVPGFATILPYLRKTLVRPFYTVYCIRDPRDVVAAHIERLVQEYSATYSDARWLGIESKDQVEVSAWRWRKYLECVMEYHRCWGSVIYVKYEDFCTNGLQTLRNCTQQLGISFDATQVDGQLQDQFNKRWNNRVMPIAGPGRWQKELHSSDIDKITTICGVFMRTWNYDLGFDTVSVSQGSFASHRNDTLSMNVPGAPERKWPQTRISASGLVLADHGQRIVCVVSDSNSETFIRAHLQRLPAKVKHLYRDVRYREDGSPIMSSCLVARLHRKLLAGLLRLQSDDLYQRGLRRFLRKEKVEVVVAEYGVAGVRVMEACNDLGIPLIVFFRGFDAYSHEVLESDIGRKYPRLFNISAAIIAVSHAMEHQLLKLGAPPDKLHYNPSGVDVSVFRGANPAGAWPVFLSAGRFVEKKAPFLTVLAFKKVTDDYPDAKLIMVGDGPLLGASKQLARTIGIQEAIQFLGALAHAEVAAKMREVRAFVLHSTRASNGDSEGTPVVILEAGASGLPVVATRHAGIQDVVIDGMTGLLVSEGDVDGMAQHMLTLARNPLLAGELGKAARERIRSEFSMEKSIDYLWQIIENHIGNGQRKGH